MGGREDFAGVAEAGGIEDGAKLLHRVQGFRRKQKRHMVALFDPDAVLAGQCPADAEAQLQNGVGGGGDTAHIVGQSLVKERDGVQIPVAGVEDVGNPQVILDADSGDGPQDFGQLGARG